jgi:hypothetical protein
VSADGPLATQFMTEVSLEDEAVIVRAFGVLNDFTASIVDECLTRLWLEGLGTVDLDLRGIVYADGSAAATLDAWTDRAADDAGDLLLHLPLLASAN